MYNDDFYPTPTKLIDKMLSKISDIREHKNILDPSVWKWDIIKYLKEKYKYWYWSLSYYGIEIEYNLRELAKEYCSIIWFDFLEYKSFNSFDLILANFPFSNWDKHFLKAWDILDRWEMVCILNAETIKNPYSETRKLILKIIEDNKWTIEYLQDEFIEAERKTKVEIALIHIKKEYSKMDWIFDWFDTEYINMYTDLWWDIKETEILVWNNKIDHLVRCCEIIKKEYMQKYISDKRFYYYVNKMVKWNNINFYWENFPKWVENINAWIFEINQQFWRQFFHDTEIRNKTTTKVFEDFMREYNDSKLDFNHKNIQTVIDIIMYKMWDIQQENINTVFDIFTKYYPENREHVEWWAHNSAWMIWKMVILPYMVELDWDWDIKGINYNSREKCRDIDKVFCNLTGKDFENIKRLEDVKISWNDTEFFQVKMYKKWTLHLTFKDKEIVKRFNLEVCKWKNWIPPNNFKFKI